MTPQVGDPPPSAGGQLADAVAAAAGGVAGVAGLHGGAFGEVATYLPGRRVTGVRLRDQVAEVHVVITWGSHPLTVARQVQAAVAPLVGTPVHVTVQDIVDAAPATDHAAPDHAAADAGHGPPSTPGSSPSAPTRPPIIKETS